MPPVLHVWSRMSVHLAMGLSLQKHKTAGRAVLEPRQAEVLMFGSIYKGPLVTTRSRALL